MHYRHLVHQAARQHRDRVAVVCGEVERTFGEVTERASRLANALGERGILRGDRVAVLLPNCAEYLEVDVGLALAGYVRVSLNVRATASQQLDVLADSGAQVLIYAEELAEMAHDVLREAPDVKHVLCLGGEPDASGDVLDYERTLAAASPAPPAVDPGPRDLYCLFYTSGTTGRPKGVMLRHGAYVSVALQLLVEFGPVAPGESILLTQPLSHGGGFFMLPWFMSGATCVVMDRFEPGRCLELAERHATETIKVVPTMLLQLLAHGGDGRELPNLRRFIYGASPMPAKQLGDLIDRYGPVFAQLYGQAEAPMCITVLPEHDHVADPRLLASAGRPWRGVDVRVVDEQGRDVGPEQPGEVLVRGPHLMSGYWQQQCTTRRVLVDGWMHTRDMARTDERGYLYLLGRSDEMIISGGFNIAPRVVEEVLNRHPAILESVVLGTPHETMGQEVTAFVSLRPGSTVAPQEIIDFTRPELGYQKPRTVRVVERLPRNAYGKVATKQLLELHDGSADA
jgi:long-chain acyl-CoA synthetase